MKKILFISHEASRTGAPLIILNFIKWLKEHDRNIQIDVLLINGGAIEEDFKKECTNTFIYSDFFGQKQLKFAEIVKKKIKSRLRIKGKEKKELFFENVIRNNYDLIYANSIVSVPIAAKIKQISQNANLLVHVHELETIIKMMLPDFANYIKYIDQYIAVSKLVQKNLVSNYAINKDKIDVVYEFGIIKENHLKKTNQFFTIGGSGTAHWRKGDDIFIQVANYIVKHFPEAQIQFIWVGNTVFNKYIIEADIKKTGLNDRIKFVGDQTEPAQFYRNFDVFLLTSREDPFPLVCIETANLSIPIICFEKASGTTEVVSKGGGFVVPYLDIQAMAEKIMLYYNDEAKRIDDGQKAKQLFDVFTLEKIGPQLYEKIILQLNHIK